MHISGKIRRKGKQDDVLALVRSVAINKTMILWICHSRCKNMHYRHAPLKRTYVLVSSLQDHHISGHLGYFRIYVLQTLSPLQWHTSSLASTYNLFVQTSPTKNVRIRDEHKCGQRAYRRYLINNCSTWFAISSSVKIKIGLLQIRKCTLNT